MKHEDEFDGLLNEALREVREAEPRMGLEGRVLAGVRAAGEERKLGWWKWVAVAAVVVMIVLGVGVRHASKEEVVVTRPEKVEEARPVESATGPAKPTERVEPSVVKAVGSQKQRRTVQSKNVVRSKREGKPDPTVMAAARAPFPTPVPLTDEEKALRRWAAARPEVMVKLNEEPKEAVENPITIRPLMTDPIPGETK